MIKKSNICAPVLFNLFNLLRKSNKMLGKPCILSFSPNLFNKFNKTQGSHRLEKYLNLERFIEMFLKIKAALKIRENHSNASKSP